VDAERAGDHEDEEHEVEDDEEEEEEDEDEEDNEDEEEEEDENKNDSKEPRIIGQEGMVNTSAANVETMVGDQPIMLHEQGQEMREHTLWPQPVASASRPQTLEPQPRPHTPETHPICGLEGLGHLTSQKPQMAVPILWQAKAAGDTTEVDVDQQLLGEPAGGGSLPDVHLCNVPLPNAKLADLAPSEPRPDSSVGKEWFSPQVAEEAMVVAFGLGSGSCLVHFHWIAQGLFYLWGLYCFYLIHTIMEHHTCCVFATPGMYVTFLWWCWGSMNLSS